MIIETFVTGPLETNTYLVGDEKAGEALVIDPAGEEEKLLAFLSERGMRVVAILNTHGHFDHISGNRVLKEATGAPILIHASDSPMLEMAAYQADLFLIRAENSPPADGFLVEGNVVKAGEVVLRVVSTPGHSPGGISLLGDGVVFCGDLVFHGSVGRTDLPGGSEKVLLASIQRHIASLPENTVIYPGHGPETTVGREKAENPFF